MTGFFFKVAQISNSVSYKATQGSQFDKDKKRNCPQPPCNQKMEIPLSLNDIIKMDHSHESNGSNIGIALTPLY